VNPLEGFDVRVDETLGSATTFSVTIINKLSVPQHA
jgi:hypothetical protein